MAIAERAPNTAQRRRNRLILGVFAVAGRVFLVLPNALIWWGTRNVCPSTITGRGTFDGTAWEILKSDCDGAVVWQMRVIPDRGYSSVVMESRGGPEPIGWEQAGFEGTVVLSAPPVGEATARVIVKLDPKGQPLGEVDFRDGKRLGNS
jgi:hypothetical protein